MNENIAPTEHQKFGLQIMTWIPTPEDPELWEIINKFNSDTNKLDSIRDLILPTVEKTGFFEKTKFVLLGIDFFVVKPSDPSGIIKTISAGKNQIPWLGDKRFLLASKDFHKDELLPKMNSDFDNFAVQEIACILKKICKKYKLDDKPIEALLLSEPNFGVKNGDFSEDLEVIELNHDEVRIYVKLTDREFGDPDEFAANTKLMDELDGLLQNQNLGRLSASEMGMGYETMFCAGQNAQAMYTVLAERLKALPNGSYIEIASNGKTDRIYPGQ